MFFSSEFDQYRRAPEINRFRTNRGACADKKVKILDGSGHDKITIGSGLNECLGHFLSIEIEFCKSKLTIEKRHGSILLVFISIQQN